jgi:hypothetical protein
MSDGESGVPEPKHGMPRGWWPLLVVCLVVMFVAALKIIGLLWRMLGTAFEQGAESDQFRPARK